MAFFVFVKMVKAPLSPALREIKQLLCVQSLILYYIKQIDSMLPYICPVIDHRGGPNVVRTSVTHSAIASCATFLSLPHSDVICDLLLKCAVQFSCKIFVAFSASSFCLGSAMWRLFWTIQTLLQAFDFLSVYTLFIYILIVYFGLCLPTLQSL